jgi:hypothetical protein
MKKIITCPHWKLKCINGYPGAKCELLNIESEDEDIANLIWDQVKECEFNKE